MWNRSILIVISICLMQASFGQKQAKNAETITIKGKVYNSNYQPVSGAVLLIDNIKTSNVTRTDGSYKIKVSSSAKNLMAEGFEFGSHEKPINGKKHIDFLLSGNTARDEPSGNEIIEGKKSRKKAKKMNTYTDIYQMIRAEVSGVVVNGKHIQIRQGHSFFGDTNPLFLINGVTVNSIDNVNPMEVESISVLKGTSAAIYGERGSHGVLSIRLVNGASEKNKPK